MLQRTAKSCGPDAPMLASSSRSCVGPTGLRQNLSVDDGGKQARSPGRARHKPLKPSRAGMPGDSGVLVVTRVRSTTTKCTRGRGCIGHPAFPTPSLGAEGKCKPRAHRAAGSRRRVCNRGRHCDFSHGLEGGDPVFRGGSDGIAKLRRTGYSAFVEYDGLLHASERNGADDRPQ
jgi:hypothetical protein